MGLYVETHVRGDLDDLWARTQDPAQHQRWDLRFTSIDHLPRIEGEPQRFRYATRVLPFLTVAGTGTCAGEKERPDGTRTSALRFASPHPLSLLAEGSGYWRYVPGRRRRPLPHRIRLPPALGPLRSRGRPAPLPPPHRLGHGLVLRPAAAVAGAGHHTGAGAAPLARRVRRARLRPAGRLLGHGVRRARGRGGPTGAARPLLDPRTGRRRRPPGALRAPAAGTPAARRCQRTPITQARAPRVLATLEQR